MSLKGFSAICLAIVLSLCAVFVTPLVTASADSVWIDKNGNGQLDSGESTFSSIGEAVAVAISGDTVLVGSGTYDANVETFPIYVEKSITLKSTDGPSATIIDGGGEDVIIIKADATTISGFTIRNCAYGIWLENGSNNNVLVNNVVENTSLDGIYLVGANYNTIENNTVSNIGGFGIYLEGSNYNTITKNFVTQSKSEGGAICLKYSGWVRDPPKGVLLQQPDREQCCGG